jgi:branched-chain amino acid transport system ATP-binding protein
VGVIGRNERRRDRGGKRDEAREILKTTGLGHNEQKLAKNLTLIEKKRLEMARALATKPRVILLDEVLAGLNPSEIQQALELIEKIRSQFKVTLFWIEHVMGAIMKASDRVIVLDQGQKITEGKPQEVVADPRVIEAYLGESDA